MTKNIKEVPTFFGEVAMCSLAQSEQYQHRYFVLKHNQLTSTSLNHSIVNTNTCTTSTSQVKIY